jgi:hypothetical protein
MVSIPSLYFEGPGCNSSFRHVTAWFDLCHFLQSRYTGTDFELVSFVSDNLQLLYNSVLKIPYRVSEAALGVCGA